MHVAAKRRVLLIGGPHDGKWRDHHEGGHMMRILRPPRLEMPKVISREAAMAEDIRVPPIEYEVYVLDKVALYGEGIWVGLHKDTVDQMDMSPDRGWRDAHTVMILRAILQRDVINEMGL